MGFFKKLLNLIKELLIEIIKYIFILSFGLLGIVKIMVCSEPFEMSDKKKFAF